jgi:hypothetical protein
VGAIEARRTAHAVPIGRDDRRVTGFYDPPGDRLGVGTVAPEEAGRVELERPTPRRDLVRELRASPDGLRALGMGDQRDEPSRLDVLGEREELVRGPGEGNLDEDDLRAFEDVPGRLLLEERRRWGQLEAEPQIERGTAAQLREVAPDLLLTLGREDKVRPNVRRSEQDLGPGGRGKLTEFQSLIERLSPVVARGENMRVTVHES